MHRHLTAVAVAMTLSFVASPSFAQTASWLTQTQAEQAQFPTEAKAIQAINADGVAITRNEFQVLGLNLADARSLASSGTFQIVSTQIGSAAKDDPFLEGVDLVGVSTDMTELKKAVDADREPFNARLAERFGVKAMKLQLEEPLNAS